MEAEQLIQDKEWESLTEAERSIVLPLAADEQEFNLLKKMLLVAREEMDEAPPLSLAVHNRLHEAMATRQRKTFRLPLWSYAAAVLILAMLGLLLVRETGHKPDAVKAPAYVHLDSKTRPTDTSRQISPPPSIAIVPQPSAQPHVPLPKHKAALPGHDQTIALANINTSVAVNGSLFDVVAEAY